MSASSCNRSIMPRSRPVSCSISWSLPIARHDNVTAPASKPTMATTTSSSRRVKPALAARAPPLLELPVTDVRIDTFTAFLAIGAIREDVEVAVLARRRVVIGLIPRIARNALQNLPPIRRDRLAGIRDECLQTLRRAGVTEVVEAIQIQRVFDLPNVLLRAADGRPVDVADELRHDGGSEQPDDDDDDHDLEQRETLLGNAKWCFDRAHYVQPLLEPAVLPKTPTEDNTRGSHRL